MAGETDLSHILATLHVSQQADPYVIVTVELPPSLNEGIAAIIAEAEGVTVVATEKVARANGWPTDQLWSWLSLDVHSSLHAVGLTAAIAKSLTEASIPCNVIAGYYHDHLLVPSGKAEQAIACLELLRAG